MNWTLPISMLCGVLAYFAGTLLPLSPIVKSTVLTSITYVQPTLLFTMLYVSFCKIRPSDLRPHTWHAWLLLIQCLCFCGITGLLHLYPSTSWRLVLESTMLVLLCPTATACAVITQKLGGDAATTTSYTITINLAIAIIAPLLLPIAHPQTGISFLPAFITIVKKVFPLLMLPLFLAFATRYWLKNLHQAILKVKDLAFYLWTIALALAIAMTCHAMANSNVSLLQVSGIAISTLLACLFQFAIGRFIGRRYGYSIEGGQALGQKNTIFIIWLGYTFLSPVTALAGGFYSIWHNVVNSWQLYKRPTPALPVREGEE